jgi:hypothetical protein
MNRSAGAVRLRVKLIMAAGFIAAGVALQLLVTMNLLRVG